MGGVRSFARLRMTSIFIIQEETIWRPAKLLSPCMAITCPESYIIPLPDGYDDIPNNVGKPRYLILNTCYLLPGGDRWIREKGY
jgi:hypothetical protein